MSIAESGIWVLGMCGILEVNNKIIHKQGDKLGCPSAGGGKGKFDETQCKKRVHLSFSARAPKTLMIFLRSSGADFCSSRWSAACSTSS